MFELLQYNFLCGCTSSVVSDIHKEHTHQTVNIHSFNAAVGAQIAHYTTVDATNYDVLDVRSSQCYYELAFRWVWSDAHFSVLNDVLV